MPIEMKPAAWVGQQVFPTIQEAQKSELAELLSDQGSLNEMGHEIIDRIIAHTDEVVAILTCAPKTKKPRSDKGKSHRKQLPEPTP